MVYFTRCNKFQDRFICFVRLEEFISLIILCVGRTSRCLNHVTRVGSPGTSLEDKSIAPDHANVQFCCAQSPIGHQQTHKYKNVLFLLKHDEYVMSHALCLRIANTLAAYKLMNTHDILAAGICRATVQLICT